VNLDLRVELILRAKQCAANRHIIDECRADWDGLHNGGGIPSAPECGFKYSVGQKW
jgi:hypothetical protein